MWISVENELRQDPRLTRLARGLKVSKVTAYGYLVWFWQWAAAYCPSGDMSNFTPEEIAEGTGWTSKTISFCSELRKSDFLLLQPDGRLLIENWEEGIMKNQKKAESDKLRMRRRREAVREQLANSKRTASERERNCSPYIENKEHKQNMNNITKTDSGEQDLISEFEKEQNSASKKNLKPEEKIIQPEKVSSSLLSGIDFTEKLNSAKLTNLVNIINQHSGMGASAPFSELAKLYNEILSGVMPELRYGKFDKATSSLVSDMWQDGVTTGEEWVKFFTEISLSSYLQGKTKIKGSENCYNTGLRYCLKNYNEVMSGTKRDKPEEKEEDIMDTFTRMYGPQSETFDSDDAIECQNYSVEEV